MQPPPILTPDDDDASSSDVQHDSPSHFRGLTERLLKRMALTSGLVARSHARQQLELTVHKIASLRSAAALLQASAVWVETNGPGAWAERLSSFSVALAFALPTVLESVEATPHSNHPI